MKCVTLYERSAPNDRDFFCQAILFTFHTMENGLHTSKDILGGQLSAHVLNSQDLKNLQDT